MSVQLLLCMTEIETVGRGGRQKENGPLTALGKKDDVLSLLLFAE